MYIYIYIYTVHVDKYIHKIHVNVDLHVQCTMYMYLHFSSVSCLKTSPTICPTPLCRDFRSSSLQSKSFERSFNSSRTGKNTCNNY